MVGTSAKVGVQTVDVDANTFLDVVEVGIGLVVEFKIADGGVVKFVVRQRARVGGMKQPMKPIEGNIKVSQSRSRSWPWSRSVSQSRTWSRSESRSWPRARWRSWSWPRSGSGSS